MCITMHLFVFLTKQTYPRDPPYQYIVSSFFITAVYSPSVYDASFNQSLIDEHLDSFH